MKSMLNGSHLPRRRASNGISCGTPTASVPGARVSVAAATQILDRAYGRPAQHIDANINEENSSVRYYALVPEPAATTEEWLESIRREDMTKSSIAGVSVAVDDEQAH
jgi:hypothetical protein